jgi:hypothetical protein
VSRKKKRDRARRDAQIRAEGGTTTADVEREFRLLMEPFVAELVDMIRKERNVLADLINIVKTEETK